MKKLSAAIEQSRMFAEVEGKFQEKAHVNYRSYYEHEDLSEKEVDRLVDSGFVFLFATWALVVGQWAYAVATRLASIVKERVGGTRKLRFVMDFLRSGVNGLSDPPERTVLPRMTDFINGILDLMVVQWQRGGDKQALERIGMMVIYFSDAFYLLHA